MSGSRFRHAHAQWSARRAITTSGPCIDAGHLSGFQRLHDEASVWVTQAEEHPPFLEPWIQWITVHSGESYHEHGVFNLDEGHRAGAPRIWDLASRAGLRSSAAA